MSYEVIISREGDDWLADVPSLPGAHTFARSLDSLKANVREVIILMDDLDDDAQPEMTPTFDMSEHVIAHATRVREERAELAKREAAVMAETAAVVSDLTSAGYSVRDTGVLVGLTPGRVSQLTTAATKKNTKAAKSPAS